MKRQWKLNMAKYATGEILYIGKIRVGHVFRPTVSRDAKPIYRAEILLPGIAMKHGTADFYNIDDAKKRLEHAVDNWFKWINEE